MAEGVAEYAEPGTDPYRILISEPVLKKMDATFECKPFYVQHVDKVDLATLKENSDGTVVRSFYNQLDGKHWVEFIVDTDRGREAIQKGWTLSNAYVPTGYGPGGQWHGVEYQKEVTSGEYEHLAGVPNPRYEESIILTPEGFKQYCADKKQELEMLENSKEKKGDSKMKFNLFKRKVENSTLDIEGLMITLPESKKDMLLSDVVTKFDAIQNMNGYANGDHMVKIGDKDEMSVNDLVKKHMEMCNEMDEMKKKMNDDVSDGDGDVSMDNADDDEDEGEESKKKNAEDEAKKKEEEGAKKNAADKAKQEAKDKAAALKNAHVTAPQEEAPVIDIMMDKLQRGMNRYAG